MRKLKTISLVFLLLMGAQAAMAQDNYILHTVAKGQGLYSISRMYGVTEADIIALNPGSDQVIKAGEQLRIPRKATADNGSATVTADEQRDGFVYHTVKDGETIYRLTVIYGVSGRDIREANPQLQGETIKVGQVIAIPLPKTEPETVTLDELERGMTPAERKAANEKKAAERKAAAQDMWSDAQEKISNAWENSGLSRIFKKKQNDSAAEPAAPSYSASDCRTEHVVRRRETVYSLAQQYGITQQELLAANPLVAESGLKTGQTICIPYPAGGTGDAKLVADQPASEGAATDIASGAAEEPTPEVRAPWSGIRAAIILPFMLDDGSVSPTADQAKMIEYYEGFLLAVDSLRSGGVSVDLYVYDSGDSKSSVKSLLDKEEMATMDIIFGPVHDKHIAEVAAFANAHQIPLVLPFARNVAEVKSNPMIWQVNAPQSVVDAEAVKQFLKKFPNPNVLFFEPKGGKKDSFSTALTKELDARGMTHTSLPADTTSDVSMLMPYCREEGDNILMLTSSENAPVNTMLPVFQLMVRDSLALDNIHLFGYPQYQIYTNSRTSQYAEVDTWFYAPFFTSSTQPDAAALHQKFHRMYSKDIPNRYPKYAVLGFDTGWWFLNVLSSHLSQASSLTLSSLPDYHCATVQTGFRFERVGDNGGWVNHYVGLIHIDHQGRTHRVE